ncbi:hypothetical protein Tco_1527282 [Tanacetum coccineum]
MVKESLQKAKNHLDKFDDVIKARMTVTETNWGNWGMKHIKDAYEAEVIPFVKNLRESFKIFEMGLYKEKKEEEDIGSLKTRLSKLVIKDSREKKEVLERERILKPVCKEVPILSRNSELFIGKEEIYLKTSRMFNGEVEKVRR